MKVTNKDIIQSYLLTTARYDFDVYEKRILYRLIEYCQSILEGKSLKGFVKPDNSGNQDVKIPISYLLKNEKDNNHSKIKSAVIRLNEKRIEYEDEHIWKLIRIIEMPKIHKYDEFIEFKIHPEIYDALLNFSKGFRKFELITAMEFKSHYSMRFYELLSNQKSPLIYTIEHLKIMFSLENKYDKVNDFIKRVIDPAQKELDKSSPYSFKYEKIKQGKKITSIKFSPIYNAKNRDVELEKNELQKKISLRWDLDKMVINYLKQNLLFDEQEIKNNMDLFKVAHEKLDLMQELSILKGKARGKKNEKGYIINALKGKLKDL